MINKYYAVGKEINTQERTGIWGYLGFYSQRTITPQEIKKSFEDAKEVIVFKTPSEAIKYIKGNSGGTTSFGDYKSPTLFEIAHEGSLTFVDTQIILNEGVRSSSDGEIERTEIFSMAKIDTNDKNIKNVKGCMLMSGYGVQSTMPNFIDLDFKEEMQNNNDFSKR